MAASEKGHLVHVYRPADSGGDDCTNGGQSSKVDSFTVVGVRRRPNEVGDKADIQPVARDSQVFTPDDDSPAAILVAGAFPGCPPKLVPLADLARLDGKSMVGPMAGGNLVDSSDSRWGALVRSFFKDDGIGDDVLLMVSAVDIHDRVETQDQYNALSI